MKKNNLFKIIGAFANKHSPELLMAAGLSGLIFAITSAIKGTVDAVHKVDAKKKEMGVDKLPPKVLAKTVWKCYIPTAVSTLVSVPCIIAGNRISDKRNASLMAACAFTETALQEYQEKTKQIVGEEKEKEIHDAVVSETVSKDNGTKTKQIVMLSDDAEQLFYESLTGRYFKSTWNKIMKACNNLNERALSGCDTFTLNEWFIELGLETTNIGDTIGWSVPSYNNKGLMRIHMTTTKTNDDKPCGAIVYDVMPYTI